MDGKVLQKRGFCVLVSRVSYISPGDIMEQTASARFRVTYDALLFRPATGATLDAQIKSVSEQAVIATAGPLEIIIPTRRMGNLSYSPELSGWVAPEQDVVLRVDTWVRCRLFSVLTDLKNTEWRCRAVGSLEEAGLGVIAVE